MTTHDEAWAQVMRHIDAETGGPFVTPPFLKKTEETEDADETDETEERPGPGRPSRPVGKAHPTWDGLGTRRYLNAQEHSTVTKTFTTTSAALFIATTRAIEAYPDEETRILKGAEIAMQPFDIQEHGTFALVKSSKGDTQYTVNSHCDCPDVVSRCKHRFSVSLHRKAAHIHKALLAPENQFCAMVGTESGIVHKVDGGFFFVPYGGPHGRFITSAEYVEGAQGPDWPAVQTEKDRWESAYYAEYDEIA
jgi:hypothetical protein